MNWKQIAKRKQSRCWISMILVLVLLAGVVFPGVSWRPAEPENPTHDHTHDITVLQLGDHSGEIADAVTSEGGEPSETKPEETEPEETEPGETEPGETESEETKPEETKPEETEPEETKPGETEPEETKPDTGDGDDGDEDGEDGDEGGEVQQLDLAMVMTWYKYGTQPKTIVCNPNEQVGSSINTAQLAKEKLKYGFAPVGEDASALTITSVTVAAGNGLEQRIGASGETDLVIPNGDSRNDTFVVYAEAVYKNDQGETVTQELTFTYVLRCAYALDLELELSWTETDGAERSRSCGANQEVSRTLESTRLTDHIFPYQLKLTGTLAADAQIVSGSYTTASGEKSGDLNAAGGSLPFKTAVGTDQETYYFTFVVKLQNREIFYHFRFVYKETLDAELRFTWLEKGVTAHEKLCQPGDSISQTILVNQLSAGALTYSLALEGNDGTEGRILRVIYNSEASGGGNLALDSGSLPMAIPDGYVSNTYLLTVSALVKGQQMNFTLRLKLCRDVSLTMTYTVAGEQRQVLCENGRTVQAEAIYDDQLPEGLLSYAMQVGGADGTNAAIGSVACYQSGSRKTIPLGNAGEVELLLKDGKTGENTFSVIAQDASGTEYTFKINIPYKHKGEANIKIETNLVDGQTVTNGEDTNLTVMAWSEDAAGNVVDYIPANGTDTKLIVTLDGQVIAYTSSSGSRSEYTLVSENPEEGDTNTHILTIYAEDSYGNYGELTLTLQGQRAMEGQVKGTATIYVDMTTLGLGVVGPVSYTVLAGEPVSYTVLKAVMGYDMGEPYGAADSTLGWGGSYGGTPDVGFYLRSLAPGYNANALENSSWPGSTEAEVLEAIDDRFGKGTGLATLWRCIYRNGLNKSSGSGGSFGEFDYTSGSGWLYTIGGSYAPGQSMSAISLEDGDVLTLRYTLAYGWDVGSGTAGYGNSVGYCVRAVSGGFSINHRMETVTDSDGSLHYVCKCCGLEEECAHEHTVYQDMGNEFHILHCEDCGKDIGDPEEHTWTHDPDSTHHSCSACAKTEEHKWQEVPDSNTATCTEAGIKTEVCHECLMERDVEAAPKGHTFGNAWQHNETQHWRKCDTCMEIIEESRGMHIYEYNEQEDDFICKICRAGHDWDYCGNRGLKVKDESCQKIEYHCDRCGLNMSKTGTFPEHHDFHDGICSECGEEDPDYSPTEPPETEPPETQPPETQPPETQPPETQPPETQPPETQPPETQPPETQPPE